MYGSGDNDYFFIDADLTGNNAGNVDQIRDFYVAQATSNPLVDDLLCFSAEQLGLSTSYMKDTLGWDEITVDIFGSNVAAYQLDFDAGGLLFPEYFFPEYFLKPDGGISGYSPERDLDFIPAFILDTENGNFYYDADGDRDVGDQILVANIASNQLGGASLSGMNANQIYVFESFDQFYNLSATTIVL